MRSWLSKTFLFSAACVFATPVLNQRRSEQITPDQILKIAPNSNSCPSPQGECATNTQAAPFLNEAMSKYQISSPGEKASVLALIAFESGNFKYNINHFPAPGRPGQGTRNMQTAPFNLKYVKSIPELASKTTHTSVDGLSPSELNDIRALVLPDKYSWASGAWYLATESSCTSARKVLQTGSDDGFIAHMKCVGIPSVGSDRMAYWQAAKKALNV
ncbi:hypothetical protein EPUL_002718 [Erysiphe pulchra]|uniref:Transglycosylase SLT domain-containing protein n=1 Tax=Erysiphe pulchra TaxID=225359 RepID=A0A2S4PUI9_9PEZI|nr:hypothetical protein EPUL_002718 [Erysiphe pulchra]